MCSVFSKLSLLPDGFGRLQGKYLLRQAVWDERLELHVGKQLMTAVLLMNVNIDWIEDSLADVKICCNQVMTVSERH